ncbi:hypothetical protein [Streptomyces sp. NPDC048637]|uniref:hypothetical protein n=1 Tax=Streptomyces sp. NPDC048637 TaxID=3155636 RepID=UPI00343E5A3C
MSASSYRSQLNRKSKDRAAAEKKVGWTTPGPTTPTCCPWLLGAQVSDAMSLYHQQTKNLLVNYSAKKLGFF